MPDSRQARVALPRLPPVGFTNGLGHAVNITLQRRPAVEDVVIVAIAKAFLSSTARGWRRLRVDCQSRPVPLQIRSG